MTERRTIGQILISTGRVTEEAVSRALDHQRAQGGYFGEALVALGIVTPEELEWSLASQYDLPYIFPDADSIDPEAAALVSPEWALANLALPITMTERTITLVVDSPLKSRAVEELQLRTNKEVELALASPGRIRDLIRQVHARLASGDAPDRVAPLGMEQAFALALDCASPRFGISTRGLRAWFWYDDRGTVRRQPLEPTYRDALDQLVTPRLSEHLESGESAVTLSAQLTRAGVISAVEVRYLAGEAGQELLFRPVGDFSPLEERYPPPPASFLAEVRLLARTGAARFVVRGDPNDLGRDVVPHLPALLLDPSWRSVHVSLRRLSSEPAVFGVAAPREADAWAREAEALRAFQFDAVTVDASGADLAWALKALDVAPVAFIYARKQGDRKAAYEAGVRWELWVVREEGERLSWHLDSLKT
jgi:type IV pilus assembly protein PilB